MDNIISIADSSESIFFKAQEKFDVIGFLNKKKFRVSDSPLSYRQINHLDDKNLIKDDRKNNKEWRKFSLKEILFFFVVKELRRYGLLDNQLRGLKQAFFGNKTKNSSDLALSLAILGKQIILTINDNGKVLFSDSLSFGFLKADDRSFIYINLNELVNDIIKARRKSGNYQSYLKFMTTVVGEKLSEKENKLLEIIRDKKYKSIRVKKKSGEINVISGDEDISEGEMLKVLKEKDFANIEVKKRDGKIVNIKLEDTFKV